MQRIGIIFAALAGIVIGQLAVQQTAGQEQATLNLVTAGDQNMVDYVKDYLGPIFEKDHPGVTVRAVGTGPGDIAGVATTTGQRTGTPAGGQHRAQALWSR